jgi:hypothetical protein
VNARGLQVFLTREKDVDVDLDERTAIANNYKADLFVSIHVNASRARGAKGSEVYFLSYQASDDESRRTAHLEGAAEPPPGTTQSADLSLILWDMAQAEHLEESSALASRIQEELAVVTGSEGRGVKQAPFRVLVGARCPPCWSRWRSSAIPRRRSSWPRSRTRRRSRRRSRGHRALPARAQRRGSAAAEGRSRLRPAGHDAAAGERAHRAGARGPARDRRAHRAALVVAAALAGGPIEPDDAGSSEPEPAPGDARAPRRAASACGSTSRATRATACCRGARDHVLVRPRAADPHRGGGAREGPAAGGLVATLAAGTRVQEVFVQAHGVACVSLSSEAARGLPGGSRAELLDRLLRRQHRSSPTSRR